MDDANIDSRHIIRVSGHKNPDSVSNYARRLSAARKRNISSLLSDSIGNEANNKRVPAVPVQQARVQVDENRNAYFQNQDDSVEDDVMNAIPQNILAPRDNQHSASQVNVVPRAFAPVLNNCSNITFNVNVYNNK